MQLRLDAMRPASPVATRWYRHLAFASAIAILVWGTAVGWLAFEQADRLGRVGADVALYVAATGRWLAGGPFYPAHQLAGPYAISDGDILYPPTTIPLFAAFRWLPAPVFVALPAAAIGWTVIRHRPAPCTWPVMAACLAFTPTLVKLVHANPFVWAAAAVALGTVYGWPAAFALVKPSLAPFALIGVRRQSWRVALLGIGVVALAFTPMWADYVTVVLNSRNDSGLLYSLQDVPLLLLPLVAWLGRAPASENVQPTADTPGPPTGA